MDVQEILEQLMERAQKRTVMTLDTFDLHVVLEPDELGYSVIKAVVGGTTYTMLPEAEKQLTDMVNLPYDFYKNAYPEMKEFNVNYLLNRIREAQGEGGSIRLSNDPNDVCPMSRVALHMLDDKILAFVDSDRAIVPSYKIFDDLAALMDEDDLVVANYVTNDTEVSFDLLASDPTVTVRMGDTAHAGISITHNDAGTGVTRLGTCIYRDCSGASLFVPSKARLSRLSFTEHGDDAVDKYIDDVHKRVKTDHDMFTVKLGAFSGLGTIKHVNPTREISEIPGLTVDERDLVLTKYLNEPMGDSYYGVVTAMMEGAEEDFIPQEKKVKIRKHAGLLLMKYIDRCDKCGAKLKQRERQRVSPSILKDINAAATRNKQLAVEELSLEAAFGV
jgi:hypothetical protein